MPTLSLAWFGGDLDTRQIDAEDWMLLTELRYQSAGPLGLITVPNGFVTDFASTPQIVWSIGMPKSGEYDKAAVVHDYLYKMGGEIDGKPIYTKAQADWVFNEAMGVLGVNKVKRAMMYAAVVMFGRGNFKKGK